ncbi:MAG: hypothetical protein ACMUIA_10645 [bacterium]
MLGPCLKIVSRKSLPVLCLALIFTLGISVPKGVCQYYFPTYSVNPYFSFAPVTPWIPSPFAPPPLLFPPPQYIPAPVLPTLPLIRYPQATIILSTGITAVSPTAGALVVGAPTIISPTTTTSVISTAVPAVTAAAPAPLLSILSIIYASALFAHTGLLSTANPLLFAYLSTLAL